jgi:hypothetical protein
MLAGRRVFSARRPDAQATAANAADFLDKAVAEMPWPIKAIQIDGGSEFMAEFEAACLDSAIPLYVLPPRSPNHISRGFSTQGLCAARRASAAAAMVAVSLPAKSSPRGLLRLDSENPSDYLTATVSTPRM